MLFVSKVLSVAFQKTRTKMLLSKDWNINLSKRIRLSCSFRAFVFGVSSWKSFGLGSFGLVVRLVWSVENKQTCPKVLVSVSL